MKVIVAAEALADIEEVDVWWRQHRPDAPDLVRTEIASALESLPGIAGNLAAFRELSGSLVRRCHLPRVHRHIYFVIDADRVVVLAVWGAVRAVLPALRARIERSRNQ